MEVHTHKSKDDRADGDRKVPTIDEIQTYQDALHISASEAAWRLFSFPAVEHHSSIERLEVYSEGKHKVYFEKGNEEVAALKSENKPTELIAWFEANKKFSNAHHIRYIEFPKYYTRSTANRQWKRREKYKVKISAKLTYDFKIPPHSVVGRMYNISPRERERYFHRTLLLHRTGMTSFKEMSKIDGKQFSSYRKACCALGLLSDDAEWMRCLLDAFASTFEPLNSFFATITGLCEPSDPGAPWDKNLMNIIEDLRRRHIGVPEAVKLLQHDQDAAQYALQEVQDVLKDMKGNPTLESFGFQVPAIELQELPQPPEKNVESA